MKDSVTVAPQCVLFDLDGTLLDTAPDLARALNRLRHEWSMAELPLSAIRPMVSKGTPGLLKAGFDICSDDPLFETLRPRFLELYANDIASQTTLFGGMGDVLNWLEARSLPWGIVTNKPGWLTKTLLEVMGLSKRPACVICGDTLVQRKPDPAPLLYGSQLVGVKPQFCWYIGDAEADIIAGNRARMVTAVASFGYIGAEEKPEQWQANHIVTSPSELLNCLKEAT
jgi:phosphoglycolate phosphatase